jgi:hypothetical protein
MSKSLFPRDVLQQAQTVLGGWNQITPIPTFGTMTAATFTTEVSAVTTLDAQITALEAQLTDKRNQRAALGAGLWDKIKRVRNAVKGIYGDDSSQYEMVGGIRMSERKTRTRKTATPA